MLGPKTKTILAIAAGAAAIAGAAFAQMRDGGMGRHHGHHDGHGGAMMQDMDLNGDGKVSAAEAEAMGNVKFLRWDYDGDGVVTEQEVIDHMMERIRQRIAKRFEKYDANGDGRIEHAEFAEADKAAFAGKDANGDGVLDGDELRAMGRHGHGMKGAREK